MAVELYFIMINGFFGLSLPSSVAALCISRSNRLKTIVTLCPCRCLEAEHTLSSNTENRKRIVLFLYTVGLIYAILFPIIATVTGFIEHLLQAPVSEKGGRSVTNAISDAFSRCQFLRDESAVFD